MVAIFVAFVLACSLCLGAHQVRVWLFSQPALVLSPEGLWFNTTPVGRVLLPWTDMASVELKVLNETLDMVGLEIAARSDFAPQNLGLQQRMWIALGFEWWRIPFGCLERPASEVAEQIRARLARSREVEPPR